MSVNISKTANLNIRTKYSVDIHLLPDIKIVTYFRLLGILFHENVSWNDHVTVTVKKASKWCVVDKVFCGIYIRHLLI